MTLTDPTDEQLNKTFAEKVAGYTMHLAPGAEWRVKEIPHFTTSADAVLPWLEKEKDVGIHYLDGDWFVRIWAKDKNCANCSPFPRAAVIALLRAHGVEVIFTAK